jgi:hypothetical protein
MLTIQDVFLVRCSQECLDIHSAKFNGLTLDTVSSS